VEQTTKEKCEHCCTHRHTPTPTHTKSQRRMSYAYTRTHAHIENKCHDMHEKMSLLYP